MPRKSVSAVSKLLVEFGVVKQPFSPSDLRKDTVSVNPGFSVFDETVGRTSNVFVRCPDASTRRQLDGFLIRNGVEVNLDYDRKGSTVNIVTAYFKGWHHDE